VRWRKLGKVFDPTAVRLPDGCHDYAQAPQALVLADRIRVFFSTRSRDTQVGKYLSHVAFVDMDKSLRNVLQVSEKTVVPLGGLGSFDEHGIFPMAVVRRGDLVYGYTTGWSRRVSVSIETAIGLVVSRDDGLSFERIGDGPVLSASLREPCLVGDGFVRQIGNEFHMWYIFGTGWRRFTTSGSPERTYKIGHASSSDGLSWQKEEGRQIVADRIGPDESQALPCVIEIAGAYHLFFCYRQSDDFRTNPTRAYRIGHAVSGNLVDWDRDDLDPLLSGGPEDWDADMQCYPHVFESDGAVYLLYNGNEFGRLGFGAAVLES
jgi:hypothetical protein